MPILLFQYWQLASVEVRPQIELVLVVVPQVHNKQQSRQTRLVPVVTTSNMAFMQMKRLGDERARRKGFENVFDRFDKNKNGKRHYDLSNFIIIAYCPRFNVCKRFLERAGQVEH